MIPHNRPTLGPAEADAAAKAVSSSWVAPGPEVKAFENEICAFLGIEDGCSIAVSSGTAALYLGLWALNAKEKRVQMPVYTCAALRNAAGMIGAFPKYLDCGPSKSPNVNSENIEKESISIIPSMFGIPATAPMGPTALWIDDAAQSLGARDDAGNAVGTRGSLGILSFYATKMITSGGHGGMVISRDARVIECIRDYLDFDCRHDQNLRFNFQMTDVQAAIGRIQLKRLPEFIARREEIFQKYEKAGLPLMKATSGSAVRYRIVVLSEKAAEIKRALLAEGIQTIHPVEDWELLDPDHASYPAALHLTQNTLSLPAYPGLTDTDQERILSAIARHI